MDRNQVRMALLKISLVVLTASTWVFSSFIFATRPEEADGDALTALVRLPASLPSQLVAPEVKTPDPIEMDVVKLACWEKSEETEQSTSARWIRLTGKHCHGGGLSENVVVRNLTNGYSATVFPTQAHGLTTDFIPLQDGRNDILIRFEQAPGVAVEQQVAFYRE